MIPYMEKEVALEIIKQFPVYVEFVESAIENYTQLCKTILETNKEEYEQAVHAHQYVLETFANQLEQENLTVEGFLPVCRNLSHFRLFSLRL